MGCIVKVINNGYEHPLALKGLIKYILTDKDTKGNTRYYDGCYINPENAEREMMDVKQYFRKTQGRQARHFIVSFDDYVCMGSCIRTRPAYQYPRYRCPAGYPRRQPCRRTPRPEMLPAAFRIRKSAGIFRRP